MTSHEGNPGRDQCLDALQTAGGAIPQSSLGDLLTGVGEAIDAAGGSFTMDYLTFVVTAVRRPLRSRSSGHHG